MDAEVVVSVPTAIDSTPHTSKKFDGHNIKADLSYRLNIPKSQCQKQEVKLSSWYTFYVLTNSRVLLRLSYLSSPEF